MIKEFKHAAFVGECRIDSDFETHLILMGNKAKDLGLVIHVTSSFRTSTDVPGAIVKPAKMSNHLVGHAIDCNIEEPGKYWNSEALKAPSGKVLELIEYLESLGMRWGGRFKAVDPVHFDDGLNDNYPAKWIGKFNQLNQK